MFSNGSYAKIWEISKFGKYSTAKISTSAKDKKTGTYNTDFTAKVKLVGQAHNCNLKGGDRIKIAKCGVENRYDKEKKSLFTSYVIFEIEQQTEDNRPPKSVGINDLPQVDEILPF